MRSTNKKFISALACASAMTALAIADPMGITTVSYTHLDVYKRQE